MKKADLASVIATEAGLTNTVANDVVTVLFDAIKDSLENGTEVNISGFGKFVVKESKAREGVNPKTKEKIQISAKKNVKFKVSPKFTESING